MSFASPLSSPSWLLTCLLVVPVCGVLLRGVLRRRIGERHLLQKRDPPTSEEATQYSVSSHVRSAGLLERWYMSQPVGEKRAFAEAIRVRSARGLPVRPTLHQLRCALSRVALAHPILLALPSPSRDQLASQVTDSDVDSDGTLAFPLTCIEECVDLVDGPVEDAMHQAADMPSEVELTAEEWSSRQSVGTKYRGVRLLLVCGDSDHEFELVLRLAHLIGDGMSGMVLLRHVVCELADICREGAPPLPARVPVSALRSIARYPAMDDLIDCRPTVGRVIEHLCDEVMTKLKSSARKVADLPWRGRNLVADPDSTALTGESRYIQVQLEAPEVAQLLSQARVNGVTLHAVWHTAMLLAAGAVSGQRSVRLDYTTPVSMRGRGAKGDAAADIGLRPADLIGNFLAGPDECITLGVDPASNSSSSLREDFWHLARSYLTRLHRDVPHSLETNGMISLVDISEYISSRVSRAWRSRVCSVATSNLGCVDVGPSAIFDVEFRSRTDDDLHLDRVWFAQTGVYSAAVFSATVVACARGGLTASIAYCTSVVSESAARTFEQAMRRTLRQVIEP